MLVKKVLYSGKSKYQEVDLIDVGQQLLSQMHCMRMGYMVYDHGDGLRGLPCGTRRRCS
jgi:hypothetical protein